MKKHAAIKIILIVSILVLIGLIGYYFWKQREQKPKVISYREQFQEELLKKETEEEDW